MIREDFFYIELKRGIGQAVNPMYYNLHKYKYKLNVSNVNKNSIMWLVATPRNSSQPADRNQRLLIPNCGNNVCGSICDHYVQCKEELYGILSGLTNTQHTAINARFALKEPHSYGIAINGISFELRQ